jgi:hypothetical protein
VTNIADVETAKILGTQDATIADRVLDNLNSVMKDTKINIEQCEFQISQLQNEQDMLFGLKALKTPMAGESNFVFDDKKMQMYLNAFINKIDVFYDADAQEHKLVIKFRIPLNDGKDEMMLDLKKTKKSA